MMNISYFAGFVCDYRLSELYTRYFTSFFIVTCLVILAYILGLKRIKNSKVRRSLLGLLVLLAIVGAHFLYLLMINGDFFGCGAFPWIAASPNPN